MLSLERPTKCLNVSLGRKECLEKFKKSIFDKSMKHKGITIPFVMLKKISSGKEINLFSTQVKEFYHTYGSNVKAFGLSFYIWSKDILDSIEFIGKSLKRLDLERTSISPSVLSVIIQKTPHINDVDISRVYLSSLKEHQVKSWKLESLKRLDLERTSMTPSVLSVIIQKTPHINDVDISRVYLSSLKEDQAKSWELESLKKSDLGYTRITDSVLSLIKSSYPKASFSTLTRQNNY